MPKIDSGAVQALATNIIIPEVLSIIRALRGGDGALPTDAEVIAKFNADADAIVAKADAFLASA
jgi:hypothetical protein